MNFMKPIANFILVFLGGGLGSSVRYLMGLLMKSNPTGFPSATFMVNITGCLLIGLLYPLLNFENQNLKLFLLIGFLGGYTTFSTFSQETVQMINSGLHLSAFFYLILSNIFGLLAVYSGIKITDFFS